MKDWVSWHKHYDAEESPLNQRLALVQQAIRECLPDKLTAPYTILDICAGDGRDLIEVLGAYEHKEFLRGRLIELDPRLASEAQERATVAQLPSSVKIIQGDASLTHAYKADIPADLILICGVFGNISDDDVARTIQNLPKFCKRGTRVIWTRNRRAPDRTGVIRSLLVENGFDETEFTSTDDDSYGIGVSAFTSSPPAMGDNVTMFRFVK
ncbi:MAG TPA: class I SAM-dependent methyltransferase [Candidatus Saccharimonadales bacterium]|nr:class I SAM-dependent methyltransferase [Candidatus Saccharimonadales bacterium]